MYITLLTVLYVCAKNKLTESLHIHNVVFSFEYYILQYYDYSLSSRIHFKEYRNCMFCFNLIFTYLTSVTRYGYFLLLAVYRYLFLGTLKTLFNGILNNHFKYQF